MYVPLWLSPEGRSHAYSPRHTHSYDTHAYDALGWGQDASHLMYQQLIPYLIKSNQELHDELQTEKTKLASVLARLDALENPTEQ